MRPALSDYGLLDGGAAIRAIFPGALVNLEVILEIATTIDPIQACTISLNSILQGFTNGSIKAPGFRFGKRIRPTERMNLCPE